MSQNQSAKQLGLPALLAIMAGTVIGPGVVSLIGPSIAVVGHGAWIAYIGAIFVGFLLIVPYALLCNAVRINGGNYCFIANNLGDLWGGIYGMCYTLNGFSLGMFGISFSMYLCALFPALNQTVVAVCFITFFFIINLFGINLMSKFQNILFVILLIGMGCYIVFGLFNIRPEALDITAPGYIQDGWVGFFSGILMLIFSTTGHFFAIAFSKEAKNPKRDMPLAMVLTSLIIMILFPLLSFVTSGVLPLEEVAGKPMSTAAQQILPTPLYFAFIIGGPLMAMCTTLNSIYISLTRPLLQATLDGWYPKKLAVTNKHGAPYFFMAFVYLMGLIPILLHMNIASITGNLVLITSITDLLVFWSVMRFPEKMPGAWENRHFKIPMPVFKALVWLAIIIRVICIFGSFQKLTPTVLAFTVGTMLLFGLYCYFRKKSHPIHIEKSYSID